MPRPAGDKVGTGSSIPTLLLVSAGVDRVGGYSGFHANTRMVLIPIFRAHDTTLYITVVLCHPICNNFLFQT